jgi:hypothetical protein
MARILETGNRSRQAFGVAVLLGALWLVHGVVPALASAQSATPAIAIVNNARIGQAGAYVRGPLTAAAGQTVQYRIVVTNNRRTPLTVTLSDARCDPDTITPSGTPTIAAGGTETYFCTHVLVEREAGSLVDIATAGGETAGGAKIGPVSSRVLVEVSASSVLGAEKIVARPKTVKPTPLRKY